MLRGKKQNPLMYVLSKTVVVARLLSSVSFIILKLYFHILW